MIQQWYYRILCGCRWIFPRAKENTKIFTFICTVKFIRSFALFGGSKQRMLADASKWENRKEKGEVGGKVKEEGEKLLQDDLVRV